MNEAITLSRLAVRLLSELEKDESTDNEPEELHRLRIVLAAFDDVSNIVEQRIQKEIRGNKSQSKSRDSGEDSDES